MRRPFLAFWLAAVAAGAVASCGSRTGLFGEGGPAGSATTSPTSSPTSTSTSSPGDTGPPLPDALPPIDVMPLPDVDRRDCPDADATFVYVVTDDNELYSFYPPTLTFKLIGRLVCPAGGATPFSMAVDRKGVAWVNIATNGAGRSNSLYKVDTTTGACEPTKIKSSYIGGMGFSTDEGTKDKETLFVFGESGSPSSPVRTLDHVDFATETIVRGPTVTSAAGELTGTGDGRLFGFVLKEPVLDPSTGKPKLDNLLSVIQIDKKTGKDSAEIVLSGVKFPHDPGFAFSFWGGDFYVYSAPLTIPPNYPFQSPPDDLKDEPTTDVARYTTPSKTTDPSYMKAIGFHIVGAGVSTCAPLTDVR